MRRTTEAEETETEAPEKEPTPEERLRALRDRVGTHLFTGGHIQILAEVLGELIDHLLASGDKSTKSSK